VYRKFNTLSGIIVLISLISLAGLFSLPKHASSQEIKSASLFFQREHPPIKRPYEISLRSRQFTPQAGVEPALVQSEIRMAGSKEGRIHMLLQLYDAPTPDDLAKLRSEGIELLSYVPHNAWFASAPVNDLTTKLASSALADIVRWAGIIRPEDKMPADIWDGRIGSWAVTEDGYVRLAVSFFDDVSLEATDPIITRYGGIIEGKITHSNKVLILLEPDKIRAIASEDVVRWLDQVPPPPTTSNDGIRAAVNANQIQAVPYGLSGQGVTIGIWDGGAVDWNHDDFKRPDGTSRVISRTHYPIADHATHVAGTMGGNGARSQAAGGTDRQWRGIAPNVAIVSYDFDDPINDYNEAIQTYHIDLSQNSWGRCIADTYIGNGPCGDYSIWISNCSDYGDYRYLAPDFDRIVTEQRIPIIFAAGNERDDEDCGMDPHQPFINYHTVTPPGSAKNTIVVGATNSEDDSMTSFSSWGPVDDGRLKPEVVAPGCEREPIRDNNVYTRTIWSTLPGNRYGGMCGTSMAAPVVSGISALLIEQYRRTYGDNPWPSTVKALLVQSAHDLNDGTSWYNPGPDYASGYGLVDAKAAVDLVRAQAIRQDTIDVDDEIDVFSVWVMTGTTQVKFTLAWDDPAAVENANSTLINDLDLLVIDPNGDSYHAWVLEPMTPTLDATTGWNDKDNLEQVLVSDPTGLPPGKWEIWVWGWDVQQGPQDYSLVSEMLFDILKPRGDGQVYAGPASSPQKIVIETTKPRGGLDTSQFQVMIGKQPARILTLYEGSDRYVLEVMPASPPANGSYDLSVMIPAASVWNVKEEAVLFADVANVDVVLTIDRSGSMGTSKMEAAKEAAKQFVDLMQYGDMVGVVSFDDLVETNFPLTTIEPPPSVPPAFHDDMEAGTSNWIADTPWALTTASSFSPSHAWTDSPGGNYENNLNISLQTATPISVSSTIITPVLRFWHRYELEPWDDRGYVEVSTDGGSNWIHLVTFTGINPTWHQVELDLSNYKGQYILVRFRLSTDSSTTYDGWYIDDVTIGQSNANAKTWAKDAIDSLYSRDMTSIGGGLQRAQEQLSTRGNANHPWAIVLLSDGLENRTPYVIDVLPTIKASKTVVHTIGLGSDADEALMLDIASQTGGTYNFAPTPEELSRVYNTIAGTVADRQTLLAITGIAQQGVTDQIDVVVDSTISEATFSISWSDSNSTLDLELRKPNGDIIDPTVAASDPNLEYVAGSTYRYYRIKKPALAVGVWQMQVTGGLISTSQEEGYTTLTSGEPYVARVTAQTSLTMRFYLDRDSYLTTEPIKLIATLSDDQPILDATVTVSIQPPSQAAYAIRSSQWVETNGDTIPDPAKAAEIQARFTQRTTSVTLYDDGLHDDGEADDGVYANAFGGTFDPGTYTFYASASGTSNIGEAFTRQSDIATYIAPNPSPNIHQIFLPMVTRNLAGRAVYNWLDATAGGTIVANGDDTYEYVDLPFAFSFYGNTYTGLYVSSNGFVSFGSGYATHRNHCIPSASAPNNAIYAFWDDLTPTGGSNGNVYVKQIDSDTVVIEWYRVRKYGTADYQTFEIVLRSDHSATLQYQSVSNTDSATVGVENATGTLAQQYICNGTGTPPTNRSAIRYTTP